MTLPDPELIADGRFLRFVQRNGWEFVERATSWAVVMLVPVDRDGRLIFVEQYREPVGQRTLEWPAGLVGDHADEEHETLATAARRELLEETGYDAGTLTELFTGVPSGGLTSETITCFLATDLTRVDAGGGDDTEDITVHTIPCVDARAWLLDAPRRGLTLDAKIFGGLYFAERFLEPEGP